MPLRDYKCASCGAEQVRILANHQDARAITYPCDACPDGIEHYSGLGTFSVRTPLPTGGYTQDGQFIRGWFDGNAPRRRKRNITVYP